MFFSPNDFFNIDNVPDPSSLKIIGSVVSSSIVIFLSSDLLLPTKISLSDIIFL